MSERTELVSIILTTLNSERYVARSIQSCLDQSHRELELIVVDGASSDRTLDVVASFVDPRIRVVHQADNAGKLPGAINLGMAAARGAFITWTQDDCWYERHAMQTMMMHLRDLPDVALVYTDYWDVDAEGKPLRYQAVSPPEDILLEDVVRVSFLFRREVFDAIGPQDTQFFPVHDVPWRIRVAERFAIAPLHQPLMYYMQHERSLTGRIGAWQLQRMIASALRTEGHLCRSAYRQRLARIDVDQAYEAFVIHGDFAGFWGHMLRGVVGNPRWLGNRGLWKLALCSLAPGRSRYRQAVYARWLDDDRASQAELTARGSSLALHALGSQNEERGR